MSMIIHRVSSTKKYKIVIVMVVVLLSLIMFQLLLNRSNLGVHYNTLSVPLDSSKIIPLQKHTINTKYLILDQRKQKITNKKNKASLSGLPSSVLSPELTDLSTVRRPKTGVQIAQVIMTTTITTTTTTTITSKTTITSNTTLTTLSRLWRTCMRYSRWGSGGPLWPPWTCPGMRWAGKMMLVMEVVVVMITPPGDILCDHHHSDHVASTNEHRGAVDQNFDQHLRDQQPRSVHPRYIFAKGNDWMFLLLREAILYQ